MHGESTRWHAVKLLRRHHSNKSMEPKYQQEEFDLFLRYVGVCVRWCHFVDVYEDMRLDVRCIVFQRTSEAWHILLPNQFEFEEFCVWGSAQHVFWTWGKCQKHRNFTFELINPNKLVVCINKDDIIIVSTFKNEHEICYLIEKKSKTKMLQ